MANSRFEYVKSYEQQIKALPETYIVIRIDGRGFTKFCQAHNFNKPTDDQAIKLMNRAADSVFDRNCFPSGTLVLAYGHSDEFSFVFHRETDIFDRRLDKIMSLVVSTFSANYVFHWNTYFPDKKLTCVPSFDARWILYPSYKSIRDYLSWRQADCHINNQYNYCFWKLVEFNDERFNHDHQKVQGFLKNTVTKDKNEILFKQFGINYNNLPEMHRKGTVIYRKGPKSGATKTEFCDIIRDDFWQKKDWLLGPLPETANVGSKRKNPEN